MFPSSSLFFCPFFFLHSQDQRKENCSLLSTRNVYPRFFMEKSIGKDRVALPVPVNLVTRGANAIQRVKYRTGECKRESRPKNGQLTTGIFKYPRYNWIRDIRTQLRPVHFELGLMKALKNKVLSSEIHFEGINRELLRDRWKHFPG